MNKYSIGGQKLNSPNRKKVLLMGLVSLFVIAIISFGTYAIWNSELLTDDNTIKSGQIKMSYTETNEITMENALPMKDEEGKLLEKYFDFQVLSYIKTRANDNTQRKINYNIVLEPITVENPLNDNEIKVYLTMVENGTETVVVEPTTIDKLTDYVLNSKDEVFKNNKGEVITSYRLRAWIDSKVDPAKFNEKKYNYKFRVNVNSSKINELVETDKSGANAPELTSNMIPVYYDEKKEVWRKADTSNNNSNWYNYDKKKWANAVTVSNFGNYKSTINNDVDTRIVSEISSYYETTTTSVKKDQNYRNSEGSRYYYSCCQSTKPSFSKETGEYSLSCNMTRNDLMNGKYCYLGGWSFKESNNTSEWSGDRNTTIYYFTSRSSSTTSSTSYVYYNYTATTYAPTPVYTPKNYKISSTYSFNTTTGKYTLTNPIIKTYSSDYVDYYMCSDKISTSCSNMYKIKRVNDDSKTIVKVDEYVAEQNLSSASTAYEVGDEIPMDKISTMWVWIPRYTYTYLNTNTPQSINIKFESGTNSSGTIKCTNNASGSGTTSETCTDSTNGSLKAGTSTYTHPAFNFGGTQLTGIWVGKFDNSSTGVATTRSITSVPIVIKPNYNPLTNKSISYMFMDIRQMEKSGNAYGFPQSSNTTFNWNGNLTNDNNNVDTHMMKNMEWGAVAYLSHSKYGTNDNIAINGNSTHITGCGPQSDNSTDINTTCNEYTTSLGQSASTTGNVYGVYDMSGGAWKYTMGNMVNSSGQFYSSTAGNWNTTTYPISKYYDSYSYDGTSRETYTRGKLGDATIEMAPTGTEGNWYNDYAYFPYSGAPWFTRGGGKSSLFNFSYDDGAAYYNKSSRTVLTIQ